MHRKVLEHKDILPKLHVDMFSDNSEENHIESLSTDKDTLSWGMEEIPIWGLLFILLMRKQMHGATITDQVISLFLKTQI
jgi:hypothetical protein